MTAVILAGGNGIRFHGSRVTVPLTESEETLLGLTLYDLHRLGFRRFIFIVNPNTRADIEEKILRRLPPDVKTTVILQACESGIPRGFSYPYSRSSPLGTGQALLLAEGAVMEYGDEDFIVMGASHFYGYSTLYDLLYHMDTVYQEVGHAHFALPGFHLGNCLSSKGPVSTAVADFDSEGRVTALRDYSRVFVSEDYTHAEAEVGGKRVPLSFDCAACMGLYYLTPDIFPYLRRGFMRFLSNPAIDLYTDEFSLTEAIHDMIKDGHADVQLIFPTQAPLILHTESEVPYMKKRLYKALSEGKYPKELM